MKDFFISFTKADGPWAEWIAWELEEAGYSVILQNWDILPGNDFVQKMQEATTETKRTIAVLSPDYFRSDFATPEWTTVFARDPTGKKQLLVPVRVTNFAPPGMFGTRTYIDIVGLDAKAARTKIIAGVAKGRGKPASRPRFPGRARPPFPTGEAPVDPQAVAHPSTPSDTAATYLAFMFTDIVSSTAMRAACIRERGSIEGEWLFKPLQVQHNSLLDGLIAQHRGTTFSTAGDAYHVTFTSARQAVECAVAIQQALARAAIGPPVAGEGVPKRLSVTIGVHVGPASRFIRAGKLDWDGHTINAVARIQQSAKADEILVSAQAWNEAGKLTGLTASAPFTRSMKGLEPIDIVQVAWRPASAPQESRTTAGSLDAEIAELRGLIADRRVIAIVGSQLAVDAADNPLASWFSLLQSGAQYCESSLAALRPGWRKSFGDLLQSRDVEDMTLGAIGVQRRLTSEDGRRLKTWLAQTVGRFECRRHDLFRALGELNTPIVTTNYDDLIEKALGWKPASWHDDLQVEASLKYEEKMVLHLHGHWRGPEFMRLGFFSHEEFMGATLAETTRERLNKARAILFIGLTPAEDPTARRVLEWLRADYGSERRLFHMGLGVAQGLDDDWSHSTRLSFGTRDDLRDFLGAIRPRPASPAPSTPELVYHYQGDCFGRESLVGDIVAAITRPVPAAVVVLGPPGLGKSTVAMAASYDPEATGRFGSRRFRVSLDSARNASEMKAQIAAALGMRVPGSTDQTVVDFLAGPPTLLWIDNVETPWWKDTGEVEAFLAVLRRLPNLALIVCLRGRERPRIPGARETLVPRLGREACLELFCSIAGEHHKEDPLLKTVLESLDGVASAISSFAQAVQGIALKSAWERWRKEGLAMLRSTHGNANELSPFETSLKISLGSPRLTPAARRLLTVLATLPGDVPLTDRIAGPAALLCKTGLAYDNDNSLLNIYGPVREYVSKALPASLDDRRWYFDELGGNAASTAVSYID